MGLLLKQVVTPYACAFLPLRLRVGKMDVRKGQLNSSFVFPFVAPAAVGGTYGTVELSCVLYDYLGR